MASPKPQSFEHHARIIPLFHVVLFGILVVNLLWALYKAATAFSWTTLLAALMAFAFLEMFFFMRLFPLTVQDRLIRLEMRLRLEKLLPADLKPRIPELTPEQLIGLRFAGDEELAALAREVLEKGITDRKEIKRRVRNWQADHLRV
jgi:Family of unknown function (DUF6526)